MISGGLKWWGYVHTNGSLQIKRYFSRFDMCDARSSPFVKTMLGPVDADDREDAKMKLLEELRSK